MAFLWNFFFFQRWWKLSNDIPPATRMEFLFSDSTVIQFPDPQYPCQPMVIDQVTLLNKLRFQALIGMENMKLLLLLSTPSRPRQFPGFSLFIERFPQTKSVYETTV